MPVSFDFLGSPAQGGTTQAGPQTINYVDNGVTFTINSDAAGGNELIWMNNAGLPLLMSAIDNNEDQFTLSFVSTANPLNTRLDGTSSNPIEFSYKSLLGTIQIEFLTSSGGVAASTTINHIDDGGAGTFSANVTGITGVRFTTQDSVFIDTITITGLTANELNCFCEGTMIATPDGEIAVEHLLPGDKIVTADGRETSVVWLGLQSVDTRTSNPAKVNPVCVRAGALGDQLPHRDLYLSPEHALELDGYLVNAGALVNGRSIFNVTKMPLDGFSYYHVETEAHDLILAEGCPAESYLDVPSREAFDNGHERSGAPRIREMDMTRVSCARLVPPHLLDRLDARADQIAGPLQAVA